MFMPDRDRHRQLNEIRFRVDRATLWVAARASGVDPFKGPGGWAQLFPVREDGRRSIYWHPGNRAKDWNRRWSMFAWWYALGQAADKLGVPMEFLVDEKYYIRKTRGFTPYRIVCEAYRKGITNLEDILPPFYKEHTQNASGVRAFLLGDFYCSGVGGGLCNTDPDRIVLNYRVSVATVLWILDYLGMPAWMLATPYKRLSEVTGAGPVEETLATLWVALKPEDRAALAGIAKALVDFERYGERVQAIREVLTETARAAALKRLAERRKRGGVGAEEKEGAEAGV